MKNHRELLDELFVVKLNFEYAGSPLARPSIPNADNILAISKEYSARGIDVIAVECKDRILEFQKQVIKSQRTDFPNAHFLFISNDGKVFDLYNVSTSKKLKPITYNEIERNTRLFREKIELFNVEAAEGTVDLKIRIEKAFDVNDKVTKKFFDKFQKVHEKLQEGITGIEKPEHVSWYASVLLNRIMFIYFLQKHRVIQNDTNFLLNKFDEVSMRGEDYYRDFLLPLFFFGFARKEGDPEKKKFSQKYGDVRYLNGGLFYPHFIENTYSNVVEEVVDGVTVKLLNAAQNVRIGVKSETLKEILEFLNGYTWYLDSRPMKDEKDINPDVLGYIFEKYINQKELGAYYTKEDITEYIAKNTIIPFVFDKLRAKGYSAPDPAPLITKNLDLRQAAADHLEGITSYDELKYLYTEVLLPLSVLDPAVGSGAFLFAALNILLPLYRKTVYKLRAFRGSVKDEWLETLCNTLEAHSEEYYLTKQIILNNLYGVDIVEEATEICKLRLFLQLASHLPDIRHIEPLPDIDFNIYAGNSLVGGLSWNDLLTNYSMKLFDREGNSVDEKKIEETIKRLTGLKTTYRTVQQSVDDDAALRTLKEEIQSLENRLNGILIDIGVSNPFHWFIEFHDIISRGGFDVVFGNPPYVEYSKIKKHYEIYGYKTESSGNLYAFFIERSLNISNNLSYTGFIVQLSMICTDRMVSVQELVKNQNEKLILASFDDRPGKLFDGLEHIRTVIVLGKKGVNRSEIFTTKYNRWYTDERGSLFESLRFEKNNAKTYVGSIPKIGAEIEKRILKKLMFFEPLGKVATDSHGKSIYFHNAPQYWIRATDFIPYFWNEVEGKKISSHVKKVLIKKEYYIQSIAILNSSIFYWWYIINSNCRDLTSREIDNFPMGDLIPDRLLLPLKGLVKKLMIDLKRNSIRKHTLYKSTGKVVFDEFYPKHSKHIIDAIDSLLAKHYCLSQEELDFIINYDIRFRMGGEEEEN